MSKVECTHERRDNRIREVATGAVVTHKSINAAKRASRKIQYGAATGKAGAALLGLGLVRRAT